MDFIQEIQGTPGGFLYFPLNNKVMPACFGGQIIVMCLLLAFTQIPNDLGREEELHLTSLQLTLDVSGPLLGRESW